MSVVGFDFGNESCIVAVARQRGIDVVLNDESKRETPSIVCFGDKQRFIGTAGAATTMMNPTNSISQIKRLIGRQFSDPELQRDLKAFPFAVTEGPDGYPLIHARYLGEVRLFTPTQVLGTVLSDLKGIAVKNLNAAVVDCCIGIPVYFTDLQRRAVLDAATIAGLHPLRLIHETTATALAYGLYKTDLPESEQLNVAFVDIGHSSMQVCIAGFKKGQLKILAHSFDRSLGGRDFDEVLFQHFVAKFREEYKIDVLQNARACLRLRAACEKLKKVLSANPEALLNIECLMDEKDVRGFIKREEFEQISVPILERVKRPLEKALAEAGLTVENVHTVEVVGSGSRVPAMIRILTEFFGKEPRRTMNASECVARGAALECAILSPTFKVRDFQVNECFPFPIALSWKGAAPESQNGAAGNQQSLLVFSKGNPIPSTKALTFYRSGTFSLDVQYADVSELQAPAKISTYTIGPFQSTKSERAKLKVKARLNLHGIVCVEAATLLEEEEIEVPVVKEPLKVDAPKRKVKKTYIPVTELVYGGMVYLDLQKAVEKEFEMALQDCVEETKYKKNAVKAYVYDMRDKLYDKYQDFVTEPEKEQFIAKLQEVKDWLYEDGEDETKGVYIAKLEELKKQGDPVEERYKEYSERGSVIDQLAYCFNSYREAAVSNDMKFDHIDIAEKQKVLNECVEAEAWLREKKQQQDALPKYSTPVFLSADVRRKADALDRFCRPIMTKPKPAKPAKPAAPKRPPTLPPQGNVSRNTISPPRPSRVTDFGLIAFTYKELRDATDNFSETNFLGEGGFAKVYKGSLSTNRKVAVKVLKNENSKVEKEFRNEVDIISRARHINIVTLIGYCITETKRLIVYEFVENKSLHDHLCGGNNLQFMDWLIRMKIAQGAAKGLAYLHDECGPQNIIHRDVKPANILLDSSFVAKVADFGIAKLCPSSFDSYTATYVIGSVGFIDPNYYETNELSCKSDVYSFGVVLLELISGETDLPKVHKLKNELTRALKYRNFVSIADPKLKNNYNLDEMTLMVTCIEACLRKDPKDRPQMIQVARVLEKIIPANELKMRTKPKRGFLFF